MGTDLTVCLSTEKWKDERGGYRSPRELTDGSSLSTAEGWRLRQQWCCCQHSPFPPRTKYSPGLDIAHCILILQFTNPLSKFL